MYLLAFAEVSVKWPPPRSLVVFVSRSRMFRSAEMRAMRCWSFSHYDSNMPSPWLWTVRRSLHHLDAQNTRARSPGREIRAPVHEFDRGCQHCCSWRGEGCRRLASRLYNEVTFLT